MDTKKYNTCLILKQNSAHNSCLLISLQKLMLILTIDFMMLVSIHINPGPYGTCTAVSKRVKDGQRPPALQAVSGVARLQGVEGLVMTGPGETLGSPWIPLAIRACISLLF
jgi:hypothetical protein